MDTGRRITPIFLYYDDAVAYVNCIKSDLAAKRAAQKKTVVKVMDLNELCRKEQIGK
jgi:hypothetical protein